MILQSLCRYYQRLKEQPRVDIALPGFAPQKISFALQLTSDGRVEDVIDLRAPDKKGKLGPCLMLTPALGQARTSGIASNFLWDKASYTLGADLEGKPEATARKHAAFKELHATLLRDCEAVEAKALLAFLERWNPEDAQGFAQAEEVLGGNIVFRVGHAYVHECPELQARWSGGPQKDGKEVRGVCLVTGEESPIAELHPPVKGVYGAQSSGASLSSFNKDSFASFGKEQNRNAPVGKFAAFAYTTALNYLLARKSQCLRYGASTAVCWAEKASPLEDALWPCLSSPEPPREGAFGAEKGGASGKSEADITAATHRATLLRRIGQGMPLREAWPELDPGVSMYVLGLAPNAARLSVSFFLQGTAEDFVRRVAAYYGELRIQRRDFEPEFPSVWQLARAVLPPQRDMEDIARLGGELLQAILRGTRYPAGLLPMTLARLRAGDTVNAVRCGLIKALLIRNFNREVPMLLDENHPDVAYHLGRIFALLAAVQYKALGDINADVRKRYFSAAAATPAMVFPLLLGNAQNHIKKARAWKYDQIIGDILSAHVDGFPKHLTLPQQGNFVLGYYHQRNSKPTQEADAEAATSTPEA